MMTLHQHSQTCTQVKMLTEFGFQVLYALAQPPSKSEPLVHQLHQVTGDQSRDTLNWLLFAK
jgi:hypothetical protein